jgi:hypothetical protein
MRRLPGHISVTLNMEAAYPSKVEVSTYSRSQFQNLDGSVFIRAVESELESEWDSEGILGGVGVGKNVPTLTPTSM